MRLKNVWKILGPGVITGASDNDPAGISTYSVAGASTGYRFLWLSLVSFPLMVAVQSTAARIGSVKKAGLGQVIQDTFGHGWLTIALISLAISNIATIGADLAGTAAGLNLLTGVGAHWFVIPVAVLIILVEVFWSYRKFADILKLLTLVLFAYVISGILAKPDWHAVLSATFVPIIGFNRTGLAVMVAIMGTTLSPYMLFWQASEEVEELAVGDGESERSGRRQLIDTVVGMFYATVVFYFIVLTSAATLNREHITHIQTAAQAARALRPIAGEYAYVLFSVGIIGAGLLAVPVLAGATAYPLSEWLHRPEGLEKDIHQARIFYTVIASSVVTGMIIALLPINPMAALFYSQVLMGLLAPVIFTLMMLISRNKRVMGEENVCPLFDSIFGWLAVVIMVFADVGLVWTFVF